MNKTTNLTTEQCKAIEQAISAVPPARPATKTRRSKVAGCKTTVEIEGLPPEPAKLVLCQNEATKSAKGAITSLEVATAKERVFVVNGIKFFAAVADSGHRLITACDEDRKKLESAGRALIAKGYDVTVKRNKEETCLWMLTAREKAPSGPWLNEDKADAKA